jgi:hypothetical protein
MEAVNNSKNVALVLIRCFGILAIAMGAMWVANISVAVLLLAADGPQWLTSPIWSVAAQGLLSAPLWLLAGMLLLKYSNKLAAFAAKGTANVA